MSKLQNIKSWEKISKESLEKVFTKDEVSKMETVEICIYYDPIDKDYIVETFGMPTSFSKNLEKLRESILEDGLLIPPDIN